MVVASTSILDGPQWPPWHLKNRRQPIGLASSSDWAKRSRSDSTFCVRVDAESADAMPESWKIWKENPWETYGGFNFDMGFNTQFMDVHDLDDLRYPRLETSMDNR